MSNFDPAAPALDDGVFGLPFTPEQARIVLLPVPWEPTTSYGRGTSRGPAAIRAASTQVDLFDLQTGRPYEAGIAMLDADPAVEAWNEDACARSEPVIAAGGVVDSDELRGGLEAVNEASTRLNQWVYEQTKRWLDKERVVGVVGGDHASPFGAIRAYAERYPGLGILHVDAHADLRQAYEGFVDSHASIFFNVHERLPTVAQIVQVGVRDLAESEREMAASSSRISLFDDPSIRRRLFEGQTFAAIASDIVSGLPEQVYISFDIDGLDPSLCPHTGTPVPGGLSFAEMCFLLDTLVRSGRKIVGFDLCEVAPGPDGDEWDANVGARVLYKLIGFTLMSHGQTAR